MTAMLTLPQGGVYTASLRFSIIDGNSSKELNMDDVIDFSSYEHGKQLLNKYGIKF